YSTARLCKHCKLWRNQISSVAWVILSIFFMRPFSAMTDKPKIEFPFRYPIKIIATAQEGVASRVISIVRNHAPDLTPDDVSTRHSSGEKFLAVRVTLIAQGDEQLRRLYAELMADTAVRMVF
ncbi:MAG: DUF493 domain-containing protein, partial [Pseudomonadota bacterium]|nr:DUF493 domain-containing protein [Pseudomonadota bacterium]